METMRNSKCAMKKGSTPPQSVEGCLKNVPSSVKDALSTTTTFKLESFSKTKSENSLLALIQPSDLSSPCCDEGNTNVQSSSSSSLERMLKRNSEVLEIFNFSPFSPLDQPSPITITQKDQTKNNATHAAVYETPEATANLRSTLTSSNKRRRILNKRPVLSAVSSLDLSDKKLSLPCLDDCPTMRQPRMRLLQRKTALPEYGLSDFDTSTFFVSKGVTTS